MKERIGFIGLGGMGSGMATNLLTKGWPLTVLAHKRRDAVDALVSAGAGEAGTAREVAEKSDVVVICVTGSLEVEEIVNGSNGLAAAGKSLLIIDCSTSMLKPEGKFEAAKGNMRAAAGRSRKLSP